MGSKDRELCATRDIPDPDRPVAMGRGEPGTVGAEGNIDDVGAEFGDVRVRSRSRRCEKANRSVASPRRCREVAASSKGEPVLRKRIAR